MVSSGQCAMVMWVESKQICREGDIVGGEQPRSQAGISEDSAG